MPSIKLLLLPVLTLWVAALAFGLGVWLAALTIRYRDLRHLIPFVLQLGIYVSPIGYTATVIPERWQMIYSLNPLVGIVGGYRWALMGDEFMANMPSVYLSIGLTVLILVSGIRYFRRRERSFVDYL
jgi:lipopolysaccharide transport system permease protein